MEVFTDEISGLGIDFQNLISCIHCHEEENNIGVIVETLKTIVSICTEEEFGRDAFRDVGGLDFLLEFLSNTDQVAILEYSLKVLAFAVDGNVHSQMQMTVDRVFKILQAIFEKKSYPVCILKNSVVFLSTILFQNRAAQDLINEDACLNSLMNLYKCYVPVYATCKSLTAEDPDSLELWLSINSTLCFAVNNPLNEKNQGICSALFPIALRTIETSSNHHVVDASSSFLSLSIANNEKNQAAFAEQDGLLILKLCLNKNIELIKSYMMECNNVISKGTLQTIDSLIGIISAAVLDHGKNAVLCGKLGIVSQMIQLLLTEVLNTSVKKKVILALGHCIEASCDNKLILLDVPQFDVLLKKNLETCDEELHSATKYLLQVCLKGYSNDLMAACSDNDYDDSKNIFMESFQERFQNENDQLQCNNKKSTKLVQNLQNSFYEKRSFHRDIECNKGNIDFSNLSYLNSKSASYQNSKDKHQYLLKYAENDLKENDENSVCDSLDGISLHSAGQLYRLNKMKLKENIQKKSTKINFDGKHGLAKDNRKYSHSENKLYDTYNPTIVSSYKVKDSRNVNEPKQNVSDTYQRKHESCISYVSKKFHRKKKSEEKNKEQMECTKIRNNESENSIPIFSKQGSMSDPQLDCLTLHNQLSDINLKDQSPLHKRRALTNLSNESHGNIRNIPNDVINLCQLNSINKEQNSEFTDAHSVFNKNAIQIRNEVLDKPLISLEIYSEPYQSARTRRECKKSSKHRTGSSKEKGVQNPRMPGCMQVIVLPGPRCFEHKLASHFEMLKVCSIKDAT